MHLEPAVGPATCKASPRHFCSFGIQSEVMIPTADNQYRAEADVGPNHAPFTQFLCIVLDMLSADLVSRP